MKEPRLGHKEQTERKKKERGRRKKEGKERRKKEGKKEQEKSQNSGGVGWSTFEREEDLGGSGRWGVALMRMFLVCACPY